MCSHIIDKNVIWKCVLALHTQVTSYIFPVIFYKKYKHMTEAKKEEKNSKPDKREQKKYTYVHIIQRFIECLKLLKMLFSYVKYFSLVHLLMFSLT